jgi:hypothetical protein
MYVYNFINFLSGGTVKVGQGRLILDVSRSHTMTHNTIGRTPLDEGSARRRNLYLTTHNTYNRHTSMPPAGFETAIPDFANRITKIIISKYLIYQGRPY